MSSWILLDRRRARLRELPGAAAPPGDGFSSVVTAPTEYARWPTRDQCDGERKWFRACVIPDAIGSRRFQPRGSVTLPINRMEPVILSRITNMNGSLNSIVGPC